MHWILKFIFGIKLYMFQTVPLSIIRSFSLYTAIIYVIQVCWQQTCITYIIAVYSEKLLMMDRGTVWNM